MKIIFLLVLGYLAVVDIIKNRIPLVVCVLMGAGITVWLVVCGNVEWISHLAGAGVGGILLLVSIVTREAVGTGDGLIFLLSGLLLGLEKNVLLLVLSLFLELAWTVVFVLACRLKKEKFSMGRVMKKRIPFLPFIFISYVYIGMIY